MDRAELERANSSFPFSLAAVEELSEQIRAATPPQPFRRWPNSEKANSLQLGVWRVVSAGVAEKLKGEVLRHLQFMAASFIATWHLDLLLLTDVAVCECKALGEGATAAPWLSDWSFVWSPCSGGSAVEGAREMAGDDTGTLCFFNKKRVAVSGSPFAITGCPGEIFGDKLPLGLLVQPLQGPATWVCLVDLSSRADEAKLQLDALSGVLPLDLPNNRVVIVGHFGLPSYFSPLGEDEGEHRLTMDALESLRGVSSLIVEQWLSPSSSPSSSSSSSPSSSVVAAAEAEAEAEGDSTGTTLRLNDNVVVRGFPHAHGELLFDSMPMFFEKSLELFVKHHEDVDITCDEDGDEPLWWSALPASRNRAMVAHLPFGPVSSLWNQAAAESSPVLTEDDVKALHAEDILSLLSKNDILRLTQVCAFLPKDRAPWMEGLVDMYVATQPKASRSSYCFLAGLLHQQLKMTGRGEPSPFFSATLARVARGRSLSAKDKHKKSSKKRHHHHHHSNNNKDKDKGPHSKGGDTSETGDKAHHHHSGEETKEPKKKKGILGFIGARRKPDAQKEEKDNKPKKKEKPKKEKKENAEKHPEGKDSAGDASASGADKSPPPDDKKNEPAPGEPKDTAQREEASTSEEPPVESPALLDSDKEQASAPEEQGKSGQEEPSKAEEADDAQEVSPEKTPSPDQKDESTEKDMRLLKDKIPPDVSPLRPHCDKGEDCDNDQPKHYLEFQHTKPLSPRSQETAKARKKKMFGLLGKKNKGPIIKVDNDWEDSEDENDPKKKKQPKKSQKKAADPDLPGPDERPVSPKSAEKKKKGIFTLRKGKRPKEQPEPKKDEEKQEAKDDTPEPKEEPAPEQTKPVPEPQAPKEHKEPGEKEDPEAEKGDQQEKEQEEQEEKQEEKQEEEEKDQEEEEQEEEEEEAQKETNEAEQQEDPKEAVAAPAEEEEDDGRDKAQTKDSKKPKGEKKADPGKLEKKKSIGGLFKRKKDNPKAKKDEEEPKEPKTKPLSPRKERRKAAKEERKAAKEEKKAAKEEKKTAKNAAKQDKKKVKEEKKKKAKKGAEKEAKDQGKEAPKEEKQKEQTKDEEPTKAQEAPKKEEQDKPKQQEQEDEAEDDLSISPPRVNEKDKEDKKEEEEEKEEKEEEAD